MSSTRELCMLFPQLPSSTSVFNNNLIQFKEHTVLVTLPFPFDDAMDAPDDEDAEVDHSPSIALEALLLNCSRKLSICISIVLGVLAIL